MDSSHISIILIHKHGPPVSHTNSGLLGRMFYVLILHQHYLIKPATIVAALITGLKTVQSLVAKCLRK